MAKGIEYSSLMNAVGRFISVSVVPGSIIPQCMGKKSDFFSTFDLLLACYIGIILRSYVIKGSYGAASPLIRGFPGNSAM